MNGNFILLLLGEESRPSSAVAIEQHNDRIAVLDYDSNLFISPFACSANSMAKGGKKDGKTNITF